MENNSLNLKKENLLMVESPLSAEKELAYRKRIAELEETLAEKERELAFLKKAVFGQKSEKTEVILESGEQMRLFNEAENNADVTQPQNLVSVAEHTRKPKGTYEDSFKNLPHEEVIHTVEDRICPECGTEMESVGKEFIRYETVYIPARMFVREHYAEVLKCPSCGNDETADAGLPDIAKPVFKKASVTEAFIPHSFCSPELLAHILYSKYVQAVPLYRQEKDFNAMGLELSRKTMSNWVIYAYEKYGQPIWSKMKEDLLTNHVLHADETVVQVLHEENRKAKTDSRMWCYCAPKYSGKSNILFEYTQTRNGDNAVQFLGDFKGYLVCDGYDGYNKPKNVTRCGCFAHVRRKFVDALPTDKALLPNSIAAQGVKWCNKIFDEDKLYDDLPPEERLMKRQECVKPILDGFFQWLETHCLNGNSNLAKAVNYALNEKNYLYRFIEDPDVPTSNNRAENAIRPFTVGRKNWLFSNSPAGANASAVWYSLAATACANGLNVEKYFTELLKSSEVLLPWHVDEN